MFGKLFGGPTVRLVEYLNGALTCTAKRSLEVGVETELKVAGGQGKPARVRVAVGSCRQLPGGGFLCTGRVEDEAHRRQLSRLSPFATVPVEGLRRFPRRGQQLQIDGSELKGVTLDVSAEGLQVATTTPLQVGQTLTVELPSASTCPARVAWVAADRAGLELFLEDDVSRLLWERVAEGKRAFSGPATSQASKLSSLEAPSYESAP